jgi:flagellar biosynthetic protein FliO
LGFGPCGGVPRRNENPGPEKNEKESQVMKTALGRGKGKLRLAIAIIGLLLVGNATFLYAGKTSPNVNRPASVPPEAEISIENKVFAQGTPPTTQQALKSMKSPSNFSNTIFGTLWTSLLFVLALIFVAAWLIRKAYPGSPLLFGSLPVLQVLGRTHLGTKQTMTLVKLDNKLILLGVTDHQINPVLTLDDPEQVSRLLTAIEQARPTGITSGFRQLFSREASEMQHHQESDADNSLNILPKNQENDVLMLKNELNLLLNKIEKFKGIGGRNISG